MRRYTAIRKPKKADGKQSPRPFIIWDNHNGCVWSNERYDKWSDAVSQENRLNADEQLVDHNR